MNAFRIISAALLLACVGTAALAEETPQPKSIGVDKPTASDSLKASLTRSGQADSLNLLLDSLDQHLLTELQRSNKFKVVAGDDLSKIISQQNMPIGAVRADDNKALAGKVSGLDWLVVTKLTEMMDAVQDREAGGQRLVMRTVQVTANVKIYDTTTGELTQSLDVPVHEEDKFRERVVGGVNGNGAEDNSLIETTAVTLAQQACGEVTETIYPAQVASVQDNTVFINRGQGTGIEPNQVWEIFAQGQSFKDPATGKVLGQTEAKVAEVVITDVMPNFSKARISGSNNGVDVGAVLRMKAPPPGPPPGSSPSDPMMQQH